MDTFFLIAHKRERFWMRAQTLAELQLKLFNRGLNPDLCSIKTSIPESLFQFAGVDKEQVE